MRSKTESLQYPSGLDLGVKSVWAIWLSTLQNIWSNKICHWFTAIRGFFFYDALHIYCNWDNPQSPQNSSEILEVERLSTRWCTKGKQRWYQETEKSEFRPDARESHTTSQAWYAAGGMPLAGGRGRGEARAGGWRAVDRAHMLQHGSLIRVWVAIHPRRTARKVRSLWVWVGSHPRRTETLLFIYRYVYKHRETKFNEHMAYCFVDKVMKFGERGVQTARVTGQKACVWVVLHPRRTGKVKPVGTSPHPAIWLRKVGLLISQSEPWVDVTCSLKTEHPGCAENQALANHRCSAEHVLLYALVKYTIQLALQHMFAYTRYNCVFWA